MNFRGLLRPSSLTSSLSSLSSSLSLSLPFLPSSPSLLLTRGRSFLGGRTIPVKSGNVEAAMARLKKVVQAEGLNDFWKETRHTRRGQDRRLQIKDNIRQQMKDATRAKVAGILASKSQETPFFDDKDDDYLFDIPKPPTVYTPRDRKERGERGEGFRGDKRGDRK